MKITGVLSDMDGVIYRGNQLIPGAKDFIQHLHETKTKFLFVTNNAEQTPLDLKRKLASLGLTDIQEENFITASMATAAFLSQQKPHGSAYVIGGGGLINELYNVGFSISENNPDYVVVGKTTGYNFEMIKKAINLVNRGAKLIATNPDMLDPIEDGFEPACGALLAPIEQATGGKAYVIGKPNPLIFTIAKCRLGTHAAETLMIGDRMDTDIVGGMEVGMQTALVLSGVSTRASVARLPYQPDHIFNHIGEINLLQLA